MLKFSEFPFLCFHREDRLCRVVAFRTPRDSGSRFCRWRLARCGWRRGAHLRHVVEVRLAVQVSPLAPSPNERGGGVKSRWREDVRIGQQVQPRQHDGGVAPGATRNARGASGRTWSRGREGAEGNPPTPSISPMRANFAGINGSSSSCSSDDSRTSIDSSNSNDSGYLPALVGRPARDLEVFVELPALQSRRTRSPSRGLTMSASYADALLAYAMRAVEAKKTMEKKAAKIERAHDSLLEERLEKERVWLEELGRHSALLD